MGDFISEDDVQVFEGFLKYQAVDPATITPEELEMWRGIFDEATERRKTSPKVGLMKLLPVAGEQKYAVAIRDGSDLWLTLWVRCSRKGEVFIMYPRGERDWVAHASYHLDGTLHQKSHGSILGTPKTHQPLTAAFRGSEHLGLYAGSGQFFMYPRDVDRDSSIRRWELADEQNLHTAQAAASARPVDACRNALHHSSNEISVHNCRSRFCPRSCRAKSFSR